MSGQARLQIQICPKPKSFRAVLTLQPRADSQPGIWSVFIHKLLFILSFWITLKAGMRFLRLSKRKHKNILQMLALMTPLQEHRGRPRNASVVPGNGCSVNCG